MTEIPAVCDQVFIISKGKLVDSDSTEHLLEKMSGTQEIELAVKGEEGASRELLLAPNGVAQVEALPQQEDVFLELT